MNASFLFGDFLPSLIAGMVLNFTIAGIALGLGLALGLLLALLRLHGGRAGASLSVTFVSLMRAAPTFVVMFFLLNVIPRDARLFGVGLALSGTMTVAVSLVPYSAAYVADAGLDAIRQMERGSPLGALLFLPNVTRAFFVLVMSSGAGAAIGVTEGISVILRESAQLPAFGDRLVLFALGIAMFGIPLQAGLALVRLLQGRLGRRMTRRQLQPSLDQ
jgi:His/Glu/Gln/Arg/opine family amino acid ABC transporter permease subunit